MSSAGVDAIIFTECNGIQGFGRDAGCYTVASRLREQGFEVQVIDFFSFFTDERMRCVIDRFVSKSTRMIGFSSTHFTNLQPEQFEEFFLDERRSAHNSAWNSYFPFAADTMERWFQWFKHKQPELKIVVGGQKVAQKRLLQKQHPGVDLWLEGQADEAIVQLMKHWEHGHGLETKKRMSAERDFSAYEDFSRSRILWSERDLLFIGEALPLEIARGCNFNCSFCDYQKKKSGELIKSESALREQLLWNHKMFGTTSYMITDSLVNEDIRKMEMIWKVFTSLPFRIEWSGFARLDLLARHPEMRDMMLESGARSIQFGIETINAKNARFGIGKPVERERTTELLHFVREGFGDQVVIGSGFIIGLPGDTEEDIRSLFDWLSHHDQVLDAFEICPLFIGPYKAEQASTIHFSRIQKDPASFGYEMREEVFAGRLQENWRHTETGLTKRTCIELLEGFQASPAWSRRLMANWVIYSRFRNLGFSHEDCLRTPSGDPNVIRRMVGSYRELAASYFKALDARMR